MTNDMNMKKIVFILYIVSVLSIRSFGQISYGGTPYSLNKPDLITDSIPVYIMAEVNAAQLMKEDSIEASVKTVPWRFGKDIDVDYNLNNSGLWQKLNNGDRIWRLTIKSKGAFSLNFIFSKFRMPRGAKLFIYNENRSVLLGAFTEKNNRDDGLFATTILEGDMATLEYYEPADAEGKGIIQLSKVIHAYKSLLKKAKGFGSSGACNVNINCPDGLAWYNEKRSVAMILEANNTRICTGTLLNNVKEDGIPYFLTANHCSEGETVGTWIFMFNYESPDCIKADGKTNETMQGAVLLAANTDSDFSLLRLSNTPPVEYNVFYSGWSADAVPSDSCVTIHHPSGDVKKISTESGKISLSDWDTGVPDSHWTIPYWNKGTTEKGSSGAALFNKYHKVIGQLHGGTASCSSQSDDNFGSFYYSWDKGSSSSTRLKDWLDPDNTGKKSINGKDFNNALSRYDAGIIQILTPATGLTCDTTFSPQIVIQNFGSEDLLSADVFYSIDNQSPVKYKWKGNLKYMHSVQVKLEAISFGRGNHTFTAYISGPDDKTDENNRNDTSSVHFTSIDGNRVMITLKTDFYAEETSWVLTDTSGAAILMNPPLISNSVYNTNICLPAGCYDFHLYDAYGDGMCDTTSMKTDTGYVQISLNNQIIGYANGCSFDSSCVIHFCLDVSVPENSRSNSIFRVYPNPNKGLFSMEYFSNTCSSAEISVFSVYGNLIRNLSIRQGIKKSIDMSWLADGVYFITLKDRHETRTVRIAVTH
jgi:hypothetical protein